MSHFCCSRSPAPSWFTSQAAAVLLTRAICASVGLSGRDARARGDICAGACLSLGRPGMAKRPLGLQSAGLAATGRACAWWMVEDNKVRPWVASRTALVLAVLYLLFSLLIALSWRIKPLEALIPEALANLLYPLDRSNLDRSRLLHFFGHSGFGGVVRASQLAMADDAGDARRDPLWPELTANLLPWRSVGVRQPHDAAPHLGRACDADSTNLGGIVAMIATATLLNLISIKPRQQS